MNTRPLVSIGIPTYNRIELLKKTVESARSQSYLNIEIIISDNCSSDGTNEWLKTLTDSNIKIVTQIENIGMIPNWNSCINVATGDLFLLLSDDDLLAVDFIEKIVDTLLGSYELHYVCFGNIETISEDGTILLKNKKIKSKTAMKVSNNDFICDFLTGNLILYPCCIVFDRKILIETGGFSTSFPLAADAVAWIKILLTSQSKYPLFSFDSLSYYRMHDQSTTSVSHKSLWADEILELTLFFEDLLKRNGLQVSKRVNSIIFRGKARSLYYKSGSPVVFLIRLMGLARQENPSIKELLFCAFRWFFPQSIWSFYKSITRKLNIF